MPLDFSCIPEAPHECQYELWGRHATIFYGNDPVEFISEFLEFVAWHNIVYEDAMMTMFAWSLKKSARTWYLNLPPSNIPSLHSFLMTFKETWLSDEDKDLILIPIDALLWVEMCKNKILVASGR